jgi:hypothetical protein
LDPFDSPTLRWELGRHVIRWEPPDLLFVSLRGPASVADAAQVQAIYDAVHERAGNFYVVFDTSRLEFMEAGARAAWIRRDKPYPIRHVVAFGASFALRTLIITVYRAGRLVAPASFPFPFEWAENEEKARLRIDEIRRAAP